MENKEPDSLLEFEQFSAAISHISSVAGTYTSEGANKYLVYKLIEALTLVLNKDFNDPKHWQTLAVYVNTGLARAVRINHNIEEAQKQAQEEVQTDE